MIKGRTYTPSFRWCILLKKCVKNRSAILKIRYTHLKKNEKSKTEKNRSENKMRFR